MTILNINYATADDLIRLGVADQKQAEALIYNAPYKDWKDLQTRNQLSPEAIQNLR